jgi:cytochrome c553
MNISTRSLLLAATLCVGSSQAWADDSSATSSSHTQAMKDCMAQQKAKDSNMSKADMRKACHDQMNMHNSATATPNQMTPTTTGQPAPSTGSTTTPPTNPPK